MELDKEFDELLGQLKPLVLKLSHREDRQRIATWIKRFCEPMSGTPSWRETRNLYTNLLKHMLERGALESPFDSHPPSGALPSLPAYLSIFFEEKAEKEVADRAESELPPKPSSSRSAYTAELRERERGASKRKITYSPKKTSSLPDLSVLATSESDSSDEDIALIMKGNRPPTPTRFNIAKTNPMFTSTPGPLKSVHFNKYGSQPTPQPAPFNAPQSVAFSTAPQHISAPPSPAPSLRGDPAPPSSGPNYKGIVEKELQMKERLLSTKFNEEKLKLQRHHDDLLQKILDKKSKEVEAFRAEYRGKVQQLENGNRTLERRLAQMTEENGRIRDQRERQAHEFKQAQAQSNANIRLDWEKKYAKCQRQGDESRAKQEEEHRAEVQTLLDETERRIGKMDAESKAQIDHMNAILRELEEKNSELRGEIEEVTREKRGVEEERGALENEVLNSAGNCTALQARIAHLEKDKEELVSTHQVEIEQQITCSANAANLAAQEHSYSVTKAQEVQTQLEQQLSAFQRSREEDVSALETKLWEIENKAASDAAKAERHTEKKLRACEKLCEGRVSEVKSELATVTKHLKTREADLQNLYKAQKEQNVKAEKSLQDFKKEMQTNTDKVYKDVQEQVALLEKDLEAAADQRDKQEAEYRQLLSEERFKSEEQTADLQVSHEKEKERLLARYHEDLEHVEKENLREKKSLEELRLKELHEVQKKSKQRIASELEVTHSLQGKVESLSVELAEVKNAHKKSLNEGVAGREREKKHHNKVIEALEVQHRADIDQLKAKQSHEMGKIVEKTAIKLKTIELEYSEKFLQNSEALNKVQASADSTTLELQRQQTLHAKSLKKVQQEFEVAKADEVKRQRGIVKALEQEVDTQRGVIRHLEKKVKMSELEAQEKIARTKLACEERLKGVVPNTIREELEETIAALKAQSTILEQKAHVLQSELNHRTSPYLKSKC